MTTISNDMTNFVQTAVQPVVSIITIEITQLNTGMTVVGNVLVINNDVVDDVDR